MSAQDQGARAGETLDRYSDKIKHTSWREVGARTGAQLDEYRHKVNETYAQKTGTGKTPEQHVKELYGATASLISHTSDYAWSWVPFTKAKAEQAKQAAKQADFQKIKEDAKKKGIELKDDPVNTELPGPTNQSIGSLFNESRALIGQFIDTAVYYIKVAEHKAEDAADDAKKSAEGTANDATRKVNAKTGGLIDYGRNTTAWFLEKSRDIITIGQQKAEEAKNAAAGAAGQAKDSVKDSAQNFRADANVSGGGQTNGDRPGFTISAQL